MTSRPALVMLGLCTTVLVLAALYFARSILAPVAFSLFVIAIVWPLQRVLQARMPALLALLATLVVTLVVMTVLGGLIAWSFGTVGRWLIDNAARFQLLYMQLTEWLEGHGILLTSLLVENFNASWLIRAVQEIGARIHGLLSFTIITFVFTVLGLLEVDVARTNIESLRNRETAHTILQSSERIADKFQKYMLVRSIMSVLTGAVVWGFALLAGLELATAWGVIAFVLNYIPFIGPLVATVFPTLFALAQFESWRLAITVFLCLNLIQFLMFQAIEIDGESYWDGGYSGNPTITPLVRECRSQDTILVQINPIERSGSPRSARDILNRLNEVSFNAVLLKELRMIALLRQVAHSGDCESAKWAHMRIHRVSSEVMVGLGYSSKLNAEWEFLSMLRDEGRRAAQAFLSDHHEDLGRRSTLDLDELLEGV